MAACVKSFFFLLLLWHPFYSADADAGKRNITADLDYLEDTEHKLDFNQVATAPDARWRKIGAPATRFVFSKSAYWFRIDLRNFPALSEFKTLYAVLEWKALDSVELFFKDRTGKIQKQIAGDTFPKSQWSLPEAHFPAVLVTPENIPEKIIYIRLFSTSIKNFPIFLKSEVAYLRDLKHEVTLIFVYSTIILVLVAFALFLYLISRDANYLIYVGYILTASLHFDVFLGNAFDLFWPEATWWQSRAVYTFIGAQVMFSMIFVSRLLDFPRVLPRVDLACKIIAVICTLMLPLTLTSLPVAIFSRIYSLTYLVSIPAFFVIGLYLISKSRPHVRLFIIGWAILFFFALFHVLYILNILPFSNFNVYGTVFVLPIDIFFFFMSLWEKQRSADRERLRLLDEKIQAFTVKSKYQKSSLADVDLGEILSRLDILMKEEKIYLIEDLRLPDLAKALGLNRTQLSELLNSHFQKNFANFINEYRVREAQRLLIESPDQNVLEIAFATGFGSKAVFSTEFKRYTGTTAMEFREKNFEKTAS